ncbi:hypothetical protein M2139_001570 [Enterococcus sp. PF1-24]|uniref:DUF4947 domain-containing protein n=1 Tax=unclassified Enterococcus TaxID=2608891 RepID=UPI002476A0F9|nr:MULTISPECIES: DUF4947 domain-containing protein [unclassified Enterococcus]MDH6364583.1 hypothetical protein [Enterococcus sp. PFB1-1]MDH6401684.1 hypothetical protein [Enterococcus sp. PF1-24]
MHCKNCGDNKFSKTATGHVCKHCGTFHDKEKKKNHLPLLLVGLVALGVIVITVGIYWSTSSATPTPIKKTHSGKTLKMTRNTTSETTASTIASSESSSSESDEKVKLPAPKKTTESSEMISAEDLEETVLLAELFLSEDYIQKAETSLANFAGTAEERKSFTKRITKAKESYTTMIKTRPETAPRADALIENPDSEFAVLSYCRYASGGFVASYPSFDQYSEADIIAIWGQPDATLTTSEDIMAKIGINKEEDGSIASTGEIEIIRNEFFTGNLTWREARAAMIVVYDQQYVPFDKALIYESQGKPNVYFRENRAEFVSLISNYLCYARQTEQHPYEGLGTYPDDFPKNYGEDGLYHP